MEYENIDSQKKTFTQASQRKIDKSISLMVCSIGLYHIIVDIGKCAHGKATVVV